MLRIWAVASWVVFTCSSKLILVILICKKPTHCFSYFSFFSFVGNSLSWVKRTFWFFLSLKLLQQPLRLNVLFDVFPVPSSILNKSTVGSSWTISFTRSIKFSKYVGALRITSFRFASWQRKHSSQSVDIFEFNTLTLPVPTPDEEKKIG